MRYIDSLNISNNTECFILIEPGIGYIIPILLEKFLNSKIIVLHIDNSFLSYRFACNRTAALFNAEHNNVWDFLEKEISDTDAARIKIIEWRPSLNFYKEKYIKLLSLTVDYIKQMDAGRRTVNAFGKRWILNFFKNLGIIKYPLLYRTMNIPIIITGSSPSLEKSIPVIHSLQESCFIIAASSSVMALLHSGIKADMIIAADGGTWALRHIYPALRETVFNSLFAANLSAALPSQCRNFPFLIINDGSLWQSIVLSSLELPSVMIPQKGTVTASAIELAMLLSSSNIYLAGIDLDISDIRTHTRPYSFDSIFNSASSRFNPLYSQIFTRSVLLKSGGSMDIYLSWFKKQFFVWPKRIFSLDNPKIFSVSIPSIVSKTEKNFFSVYDIKKDPLCFKETGIKALIAALKDQRYSKELNQELVPLLFPKTDCGYDDNVNDRDLIYYLENYIK